MLSLEDYSRGIYSVKTEDEVDNHSGLNVWMVSFLPGDNFSGSTRR